MTESSYIAALEEIYRLTLRSEGKRERRTRQICRDILGAVHCDYIKSIDDEARRAAQNQKEKNENR